MWSIFEIDFRDLNNTLLAYKGEITNFSKTRHNLPPLSRTKTVQQYDEPGVNERGEVDQTSPLSKITNNGWIAIRTSDVSYDLHDLTELTNMIYLQLLNCKNPVKALAVIPINDV